MKRKKPIPRMSARRKIEKPIYDRKRKEFLAERPICEVWLAENGWIQFEFVPGLCRYSKVRGVLVDVASDDYLESVGAPRSSVVHHREKRGKNYLNTNTWMALSWKNHGRVEGDSTYDGLPYGKSWARIQGYLSY